MRSLVGLLALAAVVYGGIVKRQTCYSGPTLLTDAQITEALDAHNTFRSNAGNNDAANEIKLTWNDALATRAQEWANQCEWGHSLTKSCDGTESLGQNLYMIGGGNAVPTNYEIYNFVKAWNDEKVDYHFVDGSCNEGKKCGHYTQVVWAKTFEVGCGIQTCPEVTMNGEVIYRNAIVFGCDYTPPGNYLGQKPYDEGAPCSMCDSILGESGQGWLCENNLCKPCTPAQDPGCICEEKVCENGGVWDADQCVCTCTSDYYGARCENNCMCENLEAYATVCPQWEVYCTQDAYKGFMTANCPKTCGFCELPETCNQ